MADWTNELRARLAPFDLPPSYELRVVEEISRHLDERVSELHSAGLPLEDARRSALDEVSYEELREAGWQRLRPRWPQPEGPMVTGRRSWGGQLSWDVRSGLRRLVRRPAISLGVITSLVLGIGANTAAFAVVNGVLFRPLPVHDPSALVLLKSGPSSHLWSGPQWQELRLRRDALGSGLAAWGAPSLVQVGLVEQGQYEPLKWYAVNGEFFRVLGISALRGRLFGADDDRGGDRVAVASDEYARRRFGNAEQIVGRTINLDRFSVTVVGVTPPEFTGPEVGRSFDLILPLAAMPEPLLAARGFTWLSVTSRLKPGQTDVDLASALRSAQADIRAATAPVTANPVQRQEYLREPFDVEPLARYTSGFVSTYRNPLLMVLAITVFIWLIACANIAGLLSAAANARRQEFAVRRAVGASSAHLVWQLLVENLILASVGGGLGLIAASWASRALVNQLSSDSMVVAVPLDWRVLVFTLSLIVTTTVVFGLGPALRVLRMSSRAGSLATVRTPVGEAGRTLGRIVVVTQVASSVVLVVGAGLFLATFGSLASKELGFDPAPVLVVELRPRSGAAATVDQSTLNSRRRALLEAIRSDPFVAGAAFSGSTPMSGIRHDNSVENPQGSSLSAAARRVAFRDVGEGWFQTLGMRMVMGRDYSAADASAPDGVIIINEALATRLFPGRNPIGEPLQEVPVGSEAEPIRRVIGVVNDAVYNSAQEGAEPTAYRLLSASHTLLVSARGGHSQQLSSAVARTVAEADPGFLTSSTALIEQVRSGFQRERVLMVVSSFFGGLALLLVGAGVYGVMAHAAAQRRREIAVRLALGGRKGQVVWLVVSQSLAVVAVGVALGVVASLWLAGLLQPLVYGLEPRDLRLTAGASLLILLVAALAAFLPARHAVDLDPAVVLREE